MAVAVAFSLDAVAAAKLPKNFEYVQLFGEDSPKEFSQYDGYFTANRYLRLELAGAVAPTFSIDWADRIYIHKAGGGMVILKSNVEISPGVEVGRVYEAGADFIVHLQTKSKSKYDALFFSGSFTEKDIRAFLQKQSFEPKSSPKVSWLWGLLSMAVAHADSSSTCATGLGHLGLDAEPIIGPGVLGEVTGCVRGILAGAWNASGGSILAVGRGVAKAVTRPIETLRSVRDGVLSIGHFVNNIGRELSRIGNEFMQLPSEIQSRIVCELASSIGTSAVISMATGGAALGLVWRSMTGVLRKVMQQFAGNQRLRAFAQKVRSMSRRTQPPEAVSYTLSAQKGYQVALDQIDELYTEFAALERNRNSLSQNFTGQAAQAGASLSLYDRRMRNWRKRFAEVRSRLSGLGRAVDAGTVAVAQSCVTLSSLQKAAGEKLRLLERRSGQLGATGSSPESQR